MKKLQFKANIISAVENVYRTMLGLDNIETYNQ